MTEKGFVPPVARRKLHARESKRQRETRKNLLLLILLVVFIFLFVIYNVWYIRSIPDTNQSTGDAKNFEQQVISKPKKLRRGRAWVSQNSQPFNQGHKASKSHHLILVAGHSVTISGHLEDAGRDESDWFLLDYQKGQGLPEAIEAHIQAGIDEANRDPDSLLLFSGGETRAVTGPLTEGASYFHVADAMQMWPPDSTVRARTVTEEFATDSFENLFKEVTGSYPSKITTISFSFKQRRFESLHAPALGWPKGSFFYIGVDPPASTGFNLERAKEGEWKNAAALFESDPYGCHSPVLQQKRKDRNPFSRTPPYPLSCPEMKDLLSYCGPDPFPRGRLPWGSS